MLLAGQLSIEFKCIHQMLFEVLAVLERVGYSVGAGCALGAGKEVICCWGGIGSNEFSRFLFLCYLGAEFNYN